MPPKTKNTTIHTQLTTLTKHHNQYLKLIYYHTITHLILLTFYITLLLIDQQLITTILTTTAATIAFYNLWHTYHYTTTIETLTKHITYALTKTKNTTISPPNTFTNTLFYGKIIPLTFLVLWIILTQLQLKNILLK